MTNVEKLRSAVTDYEFYGHLLESDEDTLVDWAVKRIKDLEKMVHDDALRIRSSTSRRTERYIWYARI